MTTSTCITHSAQCQFNLAGNTKDTLAHKERTRANPLLKALNNLMAFSFGFLLALGFGLQEINHHQGSHTSSQQQTLLADQNR